MLENGMKAPAFTLKDQSGNKVSLKDFIGQKIVIFFYPEDDTPTCTVEACNLRDNYELLMQKDFVVLGVSPDDSESHLKFANKFQLPFPLIADPTKEIIKAYGAWGKKNMYGKEYEGLLRTTFIINEEGFIDEVIQKVKTDDHTNQIINLYDKK